MNHFFPRMYAITLLSLFLCPLIVQAAPLRVAETLTLIDSDGSTLTLTEEDLRQMPQTTEEQCIWVGENSGYMGIFDCTGTCLSAILSLAKNTVDAKDFERENTYIIFRGTDDYQIITSWAELMGSRAGRRAMIMLDKDGEKLSDEEGKFRVLFPGDKYVGRSVKCLDTIEIHRAEGFVYFPKDEAPAAPEK
ncbi:MAG: molybdopterin-dependent oxidoreductase [Candidatus Hydrogenedentes bacterium]|nr:molybdopterin-dependent oxidoreductase [Candidatus Hydrogenedentota bacterium]